METHIVKGTYGSGKSSLVCAQLKAMGPRAAVLVVCYRQAQGLDFLGKLERNRIPITFYLRRTAACVTRHRHRMLISTQSLQKICPLVNYDALVIDEATSLLLDAATSGLVPDVCLQILTHLIRHTKLVIFMDVNFPERILQFITTVRTPPCVNTLPKPYPNKIIFEKSYDLWLAGLHEDLAVMNHNVVVCSDSKAVLIDLCTKLPQTIKKRVYTVGHPYASELSDVDAVWGAFQLVIYSPCITTATSYTKEHFDIVYGYFNYSSLSARSFGQQLHRVRNVKKKAIVVHVAKPKHSFLRNKKPVSVVFDTQTGALTEDPVTGLLVREHNDEITATFENFERELLKSVHDDALG